MKIRLLTLFLCIIFVHSYIKITAAAVASSFDECPGLIEEVEDKPKIPIERHIYQLRILLSPEAFHAHRRTLMSHKVGFLPGDLNLIGGMSKPNEDLLTILRDNFNVHTIVTLTEDPLRTTLFSGISFYHVPIKDHSAATKKQLHLILSYRSIERKERMMVHCLVGVGRTGLILAALFYLLSEHSMKDVISYIRTVRIGAIDDSSQEDFLLTLEEDIEARSEETRVERFNTLIDLDDESGGEKDIAKSKPVIVKEKQTCCSIQ